jgi:hypothetical protein
MDGGIESLEDGIQLDLGLTRLELATALRAQQLEDTPAARRRVAETRTRVDVLLDMWNDVLLTTA